MAANRIKGITIEIGGDTTKLQTALKGVNSEIRNTQSELRDVEKLLKIDPGNTELLTQKQRLLSDAVSETKEKLETLKTAAEQANTALANGDISKEQYDALQREIIETEQKLKDLETQASQSATALQKIASTGESLKTTGDKISEVGTKLLPVTAAVTAIGVAAVKTTADFDESMSKVAAVSGATGEEFDALREKAREMGAKTKFSASEAADAMNYMAMAGWKTSDMLAGIEGIMNLAAASGEDLATTSDIVTDALSAFGLTAADSGHFADVLAAASSNANTNVSMMGETFKYAAPVAGALGYSIDDVAAAIGLMANAGIKSSQAGTALRNILTNLQGEITLTGSALGEVTIQTANADGSMRELSDILSDCRSAFSQMTESESAAAAEALVGKNAMSGFLAIMNAAPADVEKLTSAIAGCDGTAESMAQTMQDNLSGQLTILKSQLQELAISIGDALMPIIRDIVSWIQGIVDKLNALDEGTRNTIITIALIVAAIGPALIIIGKIISAIGTIMTILPTIVSVINVVKGAMAGLNAVMLANPIILIIAAIAALVVAFIYLWNNCEEFRQFWIDLWENIKEFAVQVWEGIKTFFSEAWEAIRTTAVTVWNSIRDFFVGLWDGIINTFNTMVTAISDFLSNTWNTIKEIAETIWNSIRDFFVNLWNGIKETAISIFTGIWEGIKSTISGIYNTIHDGLTNAVNFVKDLASQAFNWGRDLISGIIDGIKSMIGKVKDAVCDVANAIADFLHFSVPEEGPLSEYESWMPDFIKGMAKGIESNKGLLTKAVEGLASDMVINPTVNGSLAYAGADAASNNVVSGFNMGELISGIREGMNGNASSGDIVIPVYLGGTLLDEVIVNAQQRSNLRSGGR